MFILKFRTIECNLEESVKVRVKIRNRSMPDITVSPSKSSFNRTGGLCGRWDDSKSSEVYVMDKDGNEEFINSSLLSNNSKARDFWQ